MALKEPVGRGRAVLAVGYSGGTLSQLEQALAHYRILPVADAATIPALVEGQQPCALVVNSLSVRCATKDAQDLCQQVGPHAPVLLCPLADEQQMARALGVEDYLIKPISRHAIVALLARLGDGIQRILVVDDDTRMARVLARMIRASGGSYEVISASDGNEGLRRMRRDRPDLVLLDLVMPGMDGHAVLAAMRADPMLQHIPVVIVTAQDRTPAEERRLNNGTLVVSQELGLSNEEALVYARAILDAATMIALRRRPGEAGQSG
jgi:CheY-like chemotaxis protein